MIKSISSILRSTTVKVFISLSLVGSAGWIVYEKITKPLVEMFLGDSFAINILVTFVLLLIASKLIGKDFIHAV